MPTTPRVLPLQFNAYKFFAVPLTAYEGAVRLWRYCARGPSAWQTCVPPWKRCCRPGRLRQQFPFRVAAWTSILSTPTPARAITFSRLAALIASGVTWVWLRTNRASASSIPEAVLRRQIRFFHDLDIVGATKDFSALGAQGSVISTLNTAPHLLCGSVRRRPIGRVYPGVAGRFPWR